jgi:hypothetical protein
MRWFRVERRAGPYVLTLIDGQMRYPRIRCHKSREVVCFVGQYSRS